MSVVTGNSIQLTTGTVTRQFGTYSMQIDLPPVSGFLSTTIKLASMPVLEQDFDFQYSADNLSEFRVNLSEITFEVFDGMGDDKSFFELVSELGIDEVLSIQSSINGRSDYFFATRNNCEYNWKKRSVTVKAKAALRYDVRVTSYSVPSGDIIDGFDNTGVTAKQWVFHKNAIDAFLSSQGSNPTKVVLGRSVYASDTAVSQDAGEPYLAISYDDIDTYSEAQDFILRLSIVEGAMMGTIMGYAFYVVRNYSTATTYYDPDTTTTVDTYANINADDIADYKIVPFEWNIRNYRTLFRAANQFDAPSEGTGSPALYRNEEVYPWGVGDLTLRYTADPIVEFEYDFANNKYVEVFGVSAPVTPYTDKLLDWNEELRDTSRQIYAYALGVPDDEFTDVRYRLNFTVFGVESVLPFQFVQFGTGINNFVDNKKLRISNVKYDLEANKVDIEGYFIG